MSIIVTEEDLYKKHSKISAISAIFVHFQFYPKNVVDFQEENSLKDQNLITFVLKIVTHAQGFWLIKIFEVSRV